MGKGNEASGMQTRSHARKPNHIETDLIFKEEFHDRPEEEIEIYLSELDRQEEENRELDELWEEYLKQQEEKKEVQRSVKATMKIVDSILNWLKEAA
jgi:hypothetical protein